MNHYYTRTKNIKYNTRLLIVSTSQKDKKVIFCVVFTTHFQRWYSPPVCAGVRSQFFALGFALGLDRFLAFVFATHLVLVFTTHSQRWYSPLSLRWCSLLGWRRDSLAISHVCLRYLFLTLVLAGLIPVLAYFFRWPSLPVPNVGTRHSVCAGVRHSFLTLVFATHFSRWYSLPIPNVGTRWPFLTLALATSTRGRKSNSSPRPGL